MAPPCPLPKPTPANKKATTTPGKASSCIKYPASRTSQLVSRIKHLTSCILRPSSHHQFPSPDFPSPKPQHLLAFLLLLSTFTHRTYTQSLQIGDPVPDIAIPNIINHTTTSVTLADYRGRLLILDFWATWCSPCVASFPKTDSLRKAFAGRADILPVTYQSKAEVDKLFARAPSLKHITVPMAVEDKVLHELFPHSGLPHYVWISPQGKVIAITDQSQVKAATITRVLQDEAITLHEKKDARRLPYNRALPLFFNGVITTPDDLDFEVIYSGYKEGFTAQGDVIRYPDNTVARMSFVNFRVKDLLQWAFSTDTLFITDDRVILESKDPELEDYYYEGRSADEILAHRKAALHCFEIRVPRRLSTHTDEIMQQEIVRLFPQYHVSLQQRNVECMAVVRTSSADKISTRGVRSKSIFDQFETSVTDKSFDFLLTNLHAYALQNLKLPLVNNTGYQGNIDIHLKGNQSSIESLKAALAAYDLDLVKQKLPVTMLVIADSR